MFTNYLKIALRNLYKHKAHAAINVAGLALGFASVFLITIYLNYELGFDKHYDEYENLYRISWENSNPQTRTPHPLAQALVSDFPEVESAVSLSPLWAAGLTREIFSVRNLEKDLRFEESSVLAVDTTFFDVFRLPVIRGDAKKALKSVNGVLLSESAAKKYFGDEDPIGKHLAVNSDTVLVEVMAIFKDIPKQSHFHFDFLVSYVREKTMDPNAEYYSWSDFGHFNYVRLKPGADPKELESKLMPWMRKYITVSDEYYQNAVANNNGFKVRPVKDIHLKSHLRWELEGNGNMEYVYILAAAALLTLVMACINFMNLMTAKSAERAKEIGIRKTLGAQRRQLSIQFLNESILVTFISIGFALLFIELALPFYNSFTGQSFKMNYVELLPVILGVGVIIAIVSGLYPSFYLSSVNPQAVLKGIAPGSARGTWLRNGLIVLQFAVSMVLISGTAVIYYQLDFIKNKNLGFDKEQVLVIPLKQESLSARIETLKSELMSIDGIQSVSAASNIPGGQFNQNPVASVERPDDPIDCSEAYVDYDILKTLNISLADGRFFVPENQADTTATFVINETAASQLRLSDPVGKEIRWDIGDTILTGRVIGVMKDFHFQSFHQPVRPLLFVLYPAFNHLMIKLNTTDFENKIERIKTTYQQIGNEDDFEFTFLDDRLNQQYQSEQRMGTMFSTFSGIAIGIACFGLFGMAMLTFSQRTKEVSIRKVLGASATGLIVLLLSDFTKLIIISVLIATPVAWWMMHQWLANFMYPVDIHPMLFLGSGLILLTLSWITLSYFTLKTSRINPAETLRSE